MLKGHIFEARNIKGIRILKIEGVFTKDTIPELQRICYSIAKDSSTRGILLDCYKISKIDTSAFACIVNFIKDHISRGINIGIINLKHHERALAELLKLDKAIRIFEDESEAIKTLSSQQ